MAAHPRNIALFPAILIAALSLTACSDDVGTPRPGRTIDPATSGSQMRDESLSGPAAVPPSGTGRDYGTPRPGRTIDPATSGQEMDRTGR